MKNSKEKQNNNNNNRYLTVPFVRYSGPFLKWTREELKQLDKRTRKLMTMFIQVDILYMSRKERGR